METLAQSIQRALDYIEEHLTEPMEIRDVAAAAYMSQFYFQRIFSVLCGMTVGEYIRGRRLTLAAQELISTDEKVIDIALRYGYDSPDSFSRAFQKMHGVLPSQAREKGVSLVAINPVHIKLSLEGGKVMEYKIVEKAPFTVMGIGRKFNADTSYREIPKFWDEWLAQGEKRAVLGMFGVCLDSDGKEFEYLIADMYCPFRELPEGCSTHVIPGGTWAVFPCKLGSLQDTNTRIWSEWLPACREYRLGGNYNIEAYVGPANEADPGETYTEIWVPLTHA